MNTSRLANKNAFEKTGPLYDQYSAQNSSRMIPIIPLNKIHKDSNILI